METYKQSQGNGLPDSEWVTVSMKWSPEFWQIEDGLNQILCAFNLENEGVIYFADARNRYCGIFTARLK